MADLPQLPSDIDEQIGDLADQTLAAREAGDMGRVLQLTEESWQVLPEPKVNWDFEPQAIARGAVEDIAESGQGTTLDTWVERMYAAYFDEGHDNLLLNMIEGHAKFVVGRTDEALAIFQKVYDTDGPAWFGEHYRPYLTMVRK